MGGGGWVNNLALLTLNITLPPPNSKKKNRFCIQSLLVLNKGNNVQHNDETNDTKLTIHEDEGQKTMTGMCQAIHKLWAKISAHISIKSSSAQDNYTIVGTLSMDDNDATENIT